jgi:hypothetical protein
MKIKDAKEQATQCIYSIALAGKDKCVIDTPDKEREAVWDALVDAGFAIKETGEKPGTMLYAASPRLLKMLKKRFPEGVPVPEGWDYNGP